MKIVHSDNVESGGGTTYRGGSSSHKILLEGEQGSIDNFSLVMPSSPGRFSPRHRHNFEQVRFQLEGSADYGTTGKMTPGMVGFFPEGVHYGPQTQEEGTMLCSLVLQNGGSSGCGYVSRGESAQATAELMEMGEFVDGVFKLPKGAKGLEGGTPGKRNLDGAQAIWEHVNKRPLEFPQPRYEQPILLDPENFAWIAMAGQPGVFQRHLGTFTEAQSGLNFFKVEPNATFAATGGRDILFAYSGTGTVNGEKLSFGTTIYLDSGESVEIKADEEITLLNLHLPDLSYLQADNSEGARAAAE
ncbi:MAG: hypothetical protein O2912_08605 [Proteobacteria bacterium]|nr:hypothetical protein [Pseudomonadota bacterium]